MAFAGSPELTARLLDDQQAQHAIEVIVRLFDAPTAADTDQPFAYAHIRFWKAAATLTAGHGPPQQRLLEAYEHQLALLSAADLPVELRPEFTALIEQVGQAAVKATRGSSIEHGSDEQALELITRTLIMFRALVRAANPWG
jgi:hypothetical protein